MTPNEALREQAHGQLWKMLAIFPENARSLMPLGEQLAEDPADVGARSNMRGHVTTSVLAFDPVCERVLLIHHRIYNRWLQPGGHFEMPPAGDPNVAHGLLWASAVRELTEETGVTSYEPLFWSGTGEVIPLDIDSHSIAENPKKGEAKHVHHDYVYLVRADATLPLAAQEEEVSGAKWVPMEKLAELGDARLERILGKLQRIKQQGRLA